MNMPSFVRSAASICVLIGALGAACAAEIPPTAPPAPPSTTPYPGTLALHVDATDLARRVLRVKETIPVQSGPLTLQYPKWLPGDHAPTGKIGQLAGLTMRAAGRPLEWRRDPADVFAFRVVVPPEARTLELEFQFLSPAEGEDSRVVVTPQIVNVQWNAVMLLPAAQPVRGITVQPSVRLPEGFRFGSALDVAAQRGTLVEFKPVDADTLVDSPIFAGRHLTRVDLDPEARSAGRPPVFLTVVADTPDELELPPEQIAAHRALVAQADKLFGTRHFPRYEFLLAVTEQLGGIGLEHHASSENSAQPGYFTSDVKNTAGRDLLAHEYTHSWNGKFRRPADLWTPDFATPMRGSLLWMYEGQTQFWGYVLAARSGLMPPADVRDQIAADTANLLVQRGREWRTLQDTTTEPLVGPAGARPWPSWQRAQNYYDEMVLVWIEADMLIRERSNGTRSLDDFARAFFGPARERGATETTPLTYTFDELVAALNAVQPFDWAAFLRRRLDTHAADTLLDGLARAGWRLAWLDKPTEFYKNLLAGGRQKTDDFAYSLGFEVGKDNQLRSVRWASPAYDAGLNSGVQLVAVNGRSYTAERLSAAITAAKAGGAGKGPIQLLVKEADTYRTVPIVYDGGLRYPTLERIPGTDDKLQQLLQPR